MTSPPSISTEAPGRERWLVCGGRDYSDHTALYDTLLDLQRDRGLPRLVIHGNATGADALAGFWAVAVGVPVLAFSADWNKYGRAAGPIRNKQMLDEGKPDLVIAFPGGRGTANMVRQARERGVEVIEVA